MASMLDAQRSGIGSLAKLGEGVRANSDAKTQAGLSRGAGEFKKLVNAAWTQTFPAQGATLDLDFANDRGFVRGVGQGRSMDAVTFTRASNGTFVKPDGTLGQHSNQGALGNNLLTFPQNFDNAAWTAGGTTASGNVITTTNGGANQYRYQQLTPVQNVSYTFAIDILKTDGATTFAGIQLVFFTGGTTASGGVTINTNTGVLTDRAGAVPQSKSIVDVGSSWRVTVTVANNTNTIMRADIYPAVNNDGSGTWIISGLTNSITADRAQLELGSTATQYFPTNINTPRFDWASTVQLANTNLLQFTEQFNNGYWTLTNGAVTANSMITTDPLGGNTADLYLPASSGNFRAVQRGTTVASLNIKTISVYAKAGGINWLSIRDNTTAWAWFDLANGVLGTVTSGYTASITSVGNGWYRCVATFTNGVVAFPTFMLSDANNGDFVTATGLTGVYFWGAQGETGTSVTDYQPIAQPTTTTPLLANPTSNGLLIEEPRANRLLWCRDATQTNWTKTNVTVAKTQTGVDGVANSASLLTASSANGICIQTITLASGSRTGSVFLKRITGTGTIQVTLDGTTYSTVDLSTSEWRRIVLSGTVTNPTVGIRIATNGDAVAMDFGQVEDGLSASTPIFTTTATVTRSVDSATRFIPDVLNLHGTTVYAEFATTGLNQNTNLSAVIGLGSTLNSNPAWNPILYRNDNSSTAANPRNINATIGVLNQVATTFGISGGVLINYEGATNAQLPSNNTVGTAAASLTVAPLNQIGFGNTGRSGNISTIGTMAIKRVTLFIKQSNTNTLQELST